jgi:tRNA(Arg) A34 adenosine deaminase TadA
MGTRRAAAADSDHGVERAKGAAIASRDGRSTEVTAQDLGFLRQAFGLAAKARSEGRHPFGCVVVNEAGEVIVTARNNALKPLGEATQHAERLACTKAAKLFDEAELRRATLYASTEPCAMCAGAIYWAGIGRVVYALPQVALITLMGAGEENAMLALPCREVFVRGGRAVVVAGPAIEDEAAVVHAGFWR